MPVSRPDVMDFLLTRRSRPARTLTAPAPDRDALVPLLTAAVRVPDHGKLEPWRFVVLHQDAPCRLAPVAAARCRQIGLDDERADKTGAMFLSAPLIVAVVFSPKPSDKIPEREQFLSAGAVCLSLVNAALASGWGASWLTGAMATDGVFLQQSLGLAPTESVAGFVVIGTESSAPPDRPRPDVDAITTWMHD